MVLFQFNTSKIGKILLKTIQNYNGYCGILSPLRPFFSHYSFCSLLLFSIFHLLFSSLESFDLFPFNTATSSSPLFAFARDISPHNSSWFSYVTPASDASLTIRGSQEVQELQEQPPETGKASWKWIRYFIPHMGFEDTWVVTWSPLSSMLKMWARAFIKLH